MKYLVIEPIDLIRSKHCYNYLTKGLELEMSSYFYYEQNVTYINERVYLRPSLNYDDISSSDKYYLYIACIKQSEHYLINLYEEREIPNHITELKNDIISFKNSLEFNNYMKSYDNWLLMKCVSHYNKVQKHVDFVLPKVKELLVNTTKIGEAMSLIAGTNGYFRAFFDIEGGFSDANIYHYLKTNFKFNLHA